MPRARRRSDGLSGRLLRRARPRDEAEFPGRADAGERNLPTVRSATDPSDRPLFLWLITVRALGGARIDEHDLEVSNVFVHCYAGNGTGTT